MKYIVIPDNKYTGDLDVHGPYETERERDDDAKILLFCDQVSLSMYFLDLNSKGHPYTYKPSEAYIDDLRSQYNEDEVEYEEDE